MSWNKKAGKIRKPVLYSELEAGSDMIESQHNEELLHKPRKETVFTELKSDQSKDRYEEKEIESQKFFEALNVT